ncbi:NADH dehydrogenase-like [Tropilaelaps mercedesae]|uniref:NADH dehydrogenase [ubiquinone] 1 alpha subcomplex subunit 10, mitochondrial n=1 Tax=Tropilaelaps mercedesae TaxID=418985 RepID=A0A1V9X0Y2_9ACAR|nr:NADH dehydrogenase-like [Tropilaelaps mercedesae]
MIVVEGNICSGKSTVAKRIAEEFDFVHFPEVTMDMMFINDNGFDIRSIEHHFPKLLRPFDEKKFYAEPDSKLVPNYLYELFCIRVQQYCDAMAHVLNTGQGVVLERSPFSDCVFVESLLKCGYVTAEDLQVHYNMQNNVFNQIYKPHLVIYLDVPVDVLQKRIMDRNNPAEVSSKIRWADYLGGIDGHYKKVYLPSLRDQSELLIYDWSSFGDTEALLEDIERVDFETSLNDFHEPKLREWKNKNTREWAEIRYMVTSKRLYIVNLAYYTPRLNHPEFVAGAEAVEEYNELYEKYYPSYEPKFDPKNGLGYLFNMGNGLKYKLGRFAFRTR